MENVQDQLRSEVRHDIFSGANWFYWLAILSVINSLIVYFLGIRNLPFAFGVTQWFDGTSAPFNPVFHTSSLIIDILIAAGFACFGLVSRKRNDVLYILGIFLYVVDALLSLGLKEFYGFAFHFLGIFYLCKGLLASRHYKENATTI